MKIFIKIISLYLSLTHICCAKESPSTPPLLLNRFTLAPQNRLSAKVFSEIQKASLFSVIKNKGTNITRKQNFIRRRDQLRQSIQEAYTGNPSPRILIAYHDDADGVMSAKITQTALKNFGSVQNIEFRSFPAFKDTDKKLKELPLEDYDRIFILDSFWAQKLFFQNDLTENIKKKLIVIDHHPSDLTAEELEETERKNLNLINLTNTGYRGESKHMPASALTALLFSEMKDSENRSFLDNAKNDLKLPLPFLLACGITGDRGYAEKRPGETFFRGGFLFPREGLEILDIKTSLMEIASIINWYLSAFKEGFDSILKDQDNITLENLVLWIKEKRKFDKTINILSLNLLQNPVYSSEKVVCFDLEKQIRPEERLQIISIGDAKYELNILKALEDRIMEIESAKHEPRIISFLQRLEKDSLYKFSFRYDGKDKNISDLLTVVQVLKDSVKQKDDRVPEFKDLLSDYLMQIKNLIETLKKIPPSLTTAEKLTYVFDSSFDELLNDILSKTINVSVKGSKLLEQISELKRILDSLKFLNKKPRSGRERAVQEMNCMSILHFITGFNLHVIPDRANQDWIPKKIKKIQGIDEDFDYYDGGGHSGAISLRFDKKTVSSDRILKDLIHAVATDVSNAFYFGKTLRDILDQNPFPGIRATSTGCLKKSA